MWTVSHKDRSVSAGLAFHHGKSFQCHLILISKMWLCREQLELFKSCMSRCAIVASLRTSAQSTAKGNQIAPYRSPQVVISSCNVPEGSTGDQAKELKLSVLTRGEPLHNSAALRNACRRLLPTHPIDQLQASHRCKQSCAYHLTLLLLVAFAGCIWHKSLGFRGRSLHQATPEQHHDGRRPSSTDTTGLDGSREEQAAP